MKVCVSVDLDNYREYASLLDPDRDAGERSFYADAVPRFLDLFDRYGIRATFFVIGRDARRPEHRAVLRRIAEGGHELGNHSYTHPYDFRRLSRAEKEVEIARAEDEIADAVGERPVGFRTPSMDVDTETLRLLAERGYLYDSSIMPSPLMWVFMLYGRLFVRRRDYQLGQPLAVFAPPSPYVPRPDRLHRPAPPGVAAELPLEIPFSVLPLVRLPFYATLLRLFGPGFFELCVRAYPRRRPLLMLLLHGIDLVDLEHDALGSALRRAPGLALPYDRRLRFTSRALSSLARAGEAVPLREVARAYRGGEEVAA